MSSARERLTRLLSLVPYLDAHPGADLEETAAYFGIDAATLIDDLELPFVTGRPGHMPDDLIDATWDGGKIFISNAEEVSVPVRLSAEEAGLLVLALELIDALPGLDAGAVRTAATKLRVAAGQIKRQIPLEEHWAFAYSMLQKVSRSFALVIQQLGPELRNAVSTNSPRLPPFSPNPHEFAGAAWRL